MKRYIFSFATLFCSIIMIAQTEFDALKFVESDIYGTARYMSMGGAFGALGGDPTAIKDNPAGLGIFRKSEITGTFNMLNQQTGAKWYDETSYNDLYKLNMNNVSFVLAVPTWKSQNGYSGLLSSNWSFSFNRLKNFNRNLNIKGGESNSSITDYMAMFTSAYRQKLGGGITTVDMHSTTNYEPFDNENLPWISLLAYEGYLINEVNGENSGQWESLLNSGETVVPAYSLQEKGYIDEFSFGWSGNFSNKLFIGTTINFHSIDYSAKSIYAENFSGGGGMDLISTYSTTGAGVNLKIGAILVPIDYLRIGLSLHTPTVFLLTDYTDGMLNYRTDNNGYIGTPTDGYSDYQLQSPFQYNLSVAFIAGKKGLISAEYVFNNYQGTRFMDEEGSSQDWMPENEGMSTMLYNSRTIKIGGEYKLTNNFALRAGYANASIPTQSTAEKLIRDNTTRTDTEYFTRNRTDFLSFGLGYQESNWHIDFGYQRKIQDENYYAFNSNNLSANLVGEPARLITTNNNIVLTLGIKF